MGRIDGKVCIVTGGALGLGNTDAAMLVKEGGKVVITDVNAEAGEAAAAELGENALFLRHDVRDEDGWKQVVATTVDRFGRLDVLVNNAGVLVADTLETATLEDWRFVNSVNVEGTFLGCKYAIPAIRASGGGSIVNLSSTAAIMGFAEAPAYTASKGAIHALTRQIAVYCLSKGDHIRCNALCPHLAASEMSRTFVEGTGVELADPNGVAYAVLFLASDESMHLNGTFLNLDRGALCIVGDVPARL